jgi:hypothetical protein
MTVPLAALQAFYEREYEAMVEIGQEASENERSNEYGDGMWAVLDLLAEEFGLRR